MPSPGSIKRDFMHHCRKIASPSSHVWIDKAALKRFAQHLKQFDFQSPDWNECLSKAALSTSPPDFLRICQEFAIFAAQNGGYIEEDAQGKSKKWHLDGSGDKALVTMFESMRSQHPMIFKDRYAIKDRKALFAQSLSGAPYPQKRVEIFEEHINRDVDKKLQQLLAEMQKSDNRFQIDMHIICRLAEIFPKSFGEDPYLKKANLWGLMVAGHLRNRGVHVDLDIIPPADYRLPETLHAAGVLKFSDMFADVINANRVFEQENKIISQLRAATIVAVDMICHEADMTVDRVDQALWQASKNGTLERLMRENPDHVKARRHFNCKTLWF